MRRLFSRGRVRHALLAVGLIAGLLAVGNPAEAVHDEGFVLQGNVTDGGAATTYDWTDLFTTATVPPTAVNPLPDGFVRASFKDDYQDPDHSAYATGSKDTLPINLGGSGDWECKKSNNIGSKFDLVNAYAAAMRVTTGTAAGHLIVYSGSEIASPNGDRNVGMWLLQDKDVNCTSDTGGNTPWTGHHRNGDVFIVSAFTNGGTKSNITVYQWTNGGTTGTVSDIGGALVQKFTTGDLNNANCASTATITASPINDNACAIENSVAEVDPPWAAPDADGGNLNINEFVESGVDLSGLGVDGCFSTAVINSRSSQEPGSTLHDFARLQFETCGNLTVHKYIDVNMNGAFDSGTDVTTGTAVQNYSMAVSGPSPSTSTVCSGTTDANGELVCSTGSLANLVPGTYTVTETQKSGYFNTDPGPNTFNTNSTVSKTVNVSFGDKDLKIGNTCYVAKTFQITNVPSGVGTINVDWQASGAPLGSQTTGTVSLVTSGTVASGTVSNIFNQKNTIAWQWYLTSDPANKVVGAAGEPLANSGYPTCAKSNTGSFDNTPITGSKFKDINGNGVKDAGEPGLGGFVFDLRSGSTTTGSVLQTTTSTASGTYAFASAVPPGTYTVTERSQTGWVQTTPTAGSGRTFTIVLNQASYDVPAFGNTPLSAITVSFTSRAKLPGTSTDATKVKNITCVDGNGSGSTVANSTSNSVTTSDVQINQNKVVCTIEYEDP